MLPSFKYLSKQFLPSKTKTSRRGVITPGEGDHLAQGNPSLPQTGRQNAWLYIVVDHDLSDASHPVHFKETCETIGGRSHPRFISTDGNTIGS